MAHWLLQCNPVKWRIFDFFAAGHELTSWDVKLNLDDIVVGDDICIWLTGRPGGVVALGRVTAEPVQLTEGEDDDAYWSDPADADPTGWSLPIALSRTFLHDPVPRVLLARDSRFSDSLILRMPGGRNPFPLTDPQWTAVLDHASGHRDGRIIDTSWQLHPGDTIRRTELHEQYGGSGRGGVAPSRTSPNILVFTDPKAGNPHGYYDEWAEDGSLLYTGEGQSGNQDMTGGNKAIRDHAIEQRALRLFQGAGGTVRYVGEFVLDPVEPYVFATAHATGQGPERQVIRFRLRPVLESQSTKYAMQVSGTSYRPQDEDADVAPPVPRNFADPDSFGQGLRTHRRLQNQLAQLVKTSGFRPLSPLAADPDYDLAWVGEDETMVVVEVKSVTAGNEIRQLRMGLGQVLDYNSTLKRRGLTVQPVLYVQRQPADDRWIDLAQAVGVILAWPGAEDRLGLLNVSPTPSRTVPRTTVDDQR
jgi:hypothetical protein